MSKYDWDEIQKYYDEGKTWKEVAERFCIGCKTISRNAKKGLFVSRSRSEANFLSRKDKEPRKLSEETKKKISVARKKFLKENPHMVPYKLNHYSQGKSYPEKYFKRLFDDNGINLVEQFPIYIYQLDFADPIRKIDIEIDGDQHYLDSKIVESDKRRNKYLEENGWIIYRIRWSDYQRLKKDSKKRIIKQIKKMIEDNFLNSEDMERIEKEIEESRKVNVCTDCKKEIGKYSKKCSDCSRKSEKISLRKVKDRPTKKELIEMIDSMSFLAIGREYEVSDNAVRKWAKSYGLI